MTYHASDGDAVDLLGVWCMEWGSNAVDEYMRQLVALSLLKCGCKATQIHALGSLCAEMKESQRETHDTIQRKNIMTKAIL